jgi:hypothetical protein
VQGFEGGGDEMEVRQQPPRTCCPSPPAPPQLHYKVGPLYVHCLVLSSTYASRASPPARPGLGMHVARSGTPGRAKVVERKVVRYHPAHIFCSLGYTQILFMPGALFCCFCPAVGCTRKIFIPPWFRFVTSTKPEKASYFVHI